MAKKKVGRDAYVPALFLLFGCQPAISGTAAAGVISMPHVLDNGVVIVYTDGTRTGIPGCATSFPNRFAFDSTTSAGSRNGRGILAAFLAGKPVYIAGTGDCVASNSSETLSYFYIAD